MGKVVMHPAAAERLRRIERELEAEARAAAEVPRLYFACERCEWHGEEPSWVDSKDWYQPPRGWLPRCPACGSYMLSFAPAEVSDNG